MSKTQTHQDCHLIFVLRVESVRLVRPQPDLSGHISAVLWMITPDPFDTTVNLPQESADMSMWDKDACQLDAFYGTADMDVVWGWGAELEKLKKCVDMCVVPRACS